MIRNTLISSAVNYIFKKEGHTFWICTELGVCLFNREKNVFESFPMLENVRVVDGATDNENNTWFSSNSGLYKYCPSDSSVIIYRNNPGDLSSVSSDLIEVCYKDASGNMWFGTEKGLDLYIRDDKFMHFLPSGDNKAIDGNHVYSIVQDHDGRFWVAIGNVGLYLFQYDAETGRGSFLRVLDGSPYHMLVDSKNQLWIGQNLGLGLNIMELTSFIPGDKPHIRVYKSNNTDIHSLSDNTISCLFEDRDHGIWIGTFAGGVSYYMSGRKKFHTVKHNPYNMNSLSNNVVNCFLEDDEFLWVGTEKGLNRYNTSTNKIVHYFFEPTRIGSLGADGVISLLKDSRGNLWIGTWNGGLNLYDYKQNKFKCFKHDNSRTGTLCSNHVFALLEDKAGNLWIGTDGGGLAQYNYVTGNFSCFTHDPDNPESISHNAVNDICQTSDGKIFVSVYHSLELFNPVAKTFKHYTHNKFDTASISAGNILDIFEDSKNNLWIATSGGLNYFDRKQERFIRYDVEDGLPNNTIQSIAEDNNGNLWLGSNKGLSKFINAVSLPDNPVFINYSVEDGLQSNEFVRRSVMKSKTGQLYFGGTRGYTCFYADSIRENSVKPTVVLIDFSIIDKQDQKVQSTTSGKKLI
jgi:ligand-binding sensor domain-containing protein